MGSIHTLRITHGFDAVSAFPAGNPGRAAKIDRGQQGEDMMGRRAVPALFIAAILAIAGCAGAPTPHQIVSRATLMMTPNQDGNECDPDGRYCSVSWTVQLCGTAPAGLPVHETYTVPFEITTERETDDGFEGIENLLVDEAQVPDDGCTTLPTVGGEYDGEADYRFRLELLGCTPETGQTCTHPADRLDEFRILR